MTTALDGKEVAAKLEQQFADAIIESSDQSVLVKSQVIPDVIGHLKNDPELGFDYLNHITAVDYYQYFELVYQMTSMKHNHTAVVKTRCYDRENPSVPSIVNLYRGADFQEREIFDLMGISFEGHPNLKRIVLWDGFQGHPLRKDFQL